MYVDVEEFCTLKEEAIMYSEITKQAENIANEIIEKAKLKKGQILVVGCSYLAAQCCEHLNRAIVVEREAVPFAEIVNVVPQPKAGGSFGTTAYKTFKNPVVVEEIKADAGIDIGGTLIGMHLKKVAVPVRLENNKLGEALVLAARVRPKYIGGERAVYDDKLM